MKSVLDERRKLFATSTLGYSGEVNGVATTYQNLIDFCERREIPADFVAPGLEDHYEERGAVRVIIHRPKVPLRIDSLIKEDLLMSLGTLPITPLAKYLFEKIH